MTTDFEWINIKTEINNHLHKTIFTEQESFPEVNFDDHSQRENLNVEQDMSEGHSESVLSDLDSDSLICESVHESEDAFEVSQSSLEIIDETEAGLTDNNTESVDNRESSWNSNIEIKNCHYSNAFYSEFAVEPNPDCQEVHQNFANNRFLNIDTNKSVNGVEKKEIERTNTTKNTLADMSVENNKLSEADSDLPDANPKHPSKLIVPTEKMTKKTHESEPSIERKIAEEIKEMKEREEELRRLREKLAQELVIKTSKHIENLKGSESSNSEEPSSKQDVKKVSSFDNCKQPNPKTLMDSSPRIEQTYKIASVFSPKRSINETKLKNIVPPQESPIEKEIRIAKEREEELKSQRELVARSQIQSDSSQEFFNHEKDFDSCTLSICSDFSLDSTQLRSPSPKGNGSFLESFVKDNISSSSSHCSLDSNEPSPNVFHKGSSSISDSSSSSKSTFSVKGISANTRSKSVDMERFISSKGKQIAFKDTTRVSPIEYQEFKPPVVKKGAHRKSISAASKIQNELQEMKEREEELKKERLILLDASRKDTNVDSADSVIECSSSNSEEISESMKKEECMTSQSRRRNTLIDAWEQRIQKSIV